MNTGKRFEHLFSRSLRELPGYSHRIEDGGASVKKRQPGDYLYSPPDSDYTFVIECKATAGKSFKFAYLRPGQTAEMLAFSTVRESNQAVLALNFYECGNACVLVNLTDYLRWKQGAERASLPYRDACAIGYECKKLPGGIWDLCLEAVTRKGGSR